MTRVRVILDCEWGDLQHALDMVIDAKPSFDRVEDRPGWGWHWSRHGKPALFIRRTKAGYSATASRDSGRHVQRGDANAAPSEGCQSGGANAAHRPNPEGTPHV